MPMNARPARLTEDEYVGAEGRVCPVCHARDVVEGGTVEISAGFAFQECSCPVCGSRWHDAYLLNGYVDLVEGARR
jgi:formate dehydrogenase maturation protein FdhE